MLYYNIYFYIRDLIVKKFSIDHPALYGKPKLDPLNTDNVINSFKQILNILKGRNHYGAGICNICFIHLINIDFNILYYNRPLHSGYYYHSYFYPKIDTADYSNTILPRIKLVKRIIKQIEAGYYN